MGLLVDGVWRTDWYDTKESGGRFRREASKFRDRITADGSSGFAAEGAGGESRRIGSRRRRLA